MFKTTPHERPNVTDDRERWNEKHSDDGDFELPRNPIPELERSVDASPDGRALDVATGTARNAIFPNRFSLNRRGVGSRSICRPRGR